MKSSAKNISLNSYDDIFSTEETREDAKREKVTDMPLSELHPFPDHPFQVRDDDSMKETVESIKEYGVLVPAIVRPRADGGYELISGHRRKHACELAGLPTMPVIVRDLDDDAATIIMVDSNIQRENILPSERAKAYKMKLDAIKRQAGRPSKENAPKISANLRSDDEIGEKMGMSGDTLLSAMETAGAKEMPDDAERKGLGTPATRAAILEKLVTTGFVERKRAKKTVNLIPSQVGVSLVTVLPEQLQSPLLTAEWENRLKQVERGELEPDAFMDGIAGMLRELVKTYTPVKGAEVLFPSGREIIGKCPRCGGSVTESKKGFFCENDGCRFGLWKDNRFFAAKKKVLTKAVAAAFLKDGRVRLTGCYSEKAGKTYDATVILEDTGGRVNFKLEFDLGTKKRGGS